MTKIIRGRMFHYDDDSMMFEAYRSNPQENTPWRVLAVTDGGRLLLSNDKISLRVTLKRKPTSAQLTSELLSHFGRLVAALTQKELNRKE